MPTVGYISTHNDDAILFRGEWLYRDLHTPGTHVTMIVPNCADAGGGFADEWWRRKEAGTVAAMGASMSPNPVVQDTVLINGHDVVRYSTTGWSAWFMRFPDGGVSGGGYPVNGSASLQDLAANTIPDLKSIDGLNTYVDMADIGATIRGIMVHDGWEPGRSINMGDPNRTINPGDHPDHISINDATFPVFADTPRTLWVSYQVRYKTSNLSGWDLAAKRFLFERYCRTAGSTVNEEEWGWWGKKSYSRTIRPV